MKTTKWQRTVSLLLCLLMAMSFLTVAAPKAYAADDVTAAASEVTWPQITSFTVTDGYLYDKSKASSRTAACEVETTEAEIVNYTELRKSANDYLGLAGEIRIKVKSPVSVADGSPTTTPAKAPGFLRLLSGGYSMTASKDATVVTDRNLTTAPSATDPNTYRSSNNDAVRVAIQDTGKKWYYYDLVVTIDTQSGETNTAPTIKEGMVNPATADATVGTAWTLDLTTIFEDADNDTLTYKVKVGDAEAVAADANYSYTPTAAGTTKLVFTSNDGKADSPEYTVTLNVTAAAGEVTWPQITSFTVTDGYLYDKSKASSRTAACEVETTEAEIVNYTELRKSANDYLGLAGEIRIKVKSPVSVADGSPTTTPAKAPGFLRLLSGGYSMTASKDATVVTDRNLTTAPSATDPNTYRSSNNDAVRVAIQDTGKKWYYYDLVVTIDTQSGETNTAPTIKEGMVNPATADATVGTAWTLDLTTIFEDADNDTLTYKVKVGDAEAVAADANYSYTPTAAGTTKLVFTSNDGKADSPEYTVTLNVTAAAGEVTWPQVTSFAVTDGYLYDSSKVANRKVACKVKTIEIVNYTKAKESASTGYMGLIGEICIKVEKPVSIVDGVPTTTLAAAPFYLRIAKDSYTMTASKEATVVTDRNLTTTNSTTDPNIYRSSNDDGVRVAIKDPSQNNKLYYYDLVVTIDTQSSETNTAPAIKENVVNPATADTTVGTPWTLDLTTIFEDADNDTLTYKVSVNGADPVDADVNYSYKPTVAGPTTLVFTANDGKADSPTYTVTLTATAAEVTYAITATVDGEYIVNVENETRPMGETEITVNGTSASEAKAGDHIVVKATPQKCNLFNTDLYDAKFDHWEVVAGPTGFLSNDALKNAKLTFNMPAAAVSLKAVFVTVGSQVTLTANDFNAGDVSLMIGDWAVVASTYDSTSGKHMNDSVTRTVIAGAKVSAVINAGTNNAGYKLVGWEITNTTTNEQVKFKYDAGYGGIERPYFTVDGTSNYTISAIFAAKDYGNVNVTVNDEIMGTATAQIGTEEAATSLIGVVERTKIKLQAQPKTGYVFQSWSVTYGSDNTQVEIANSTEAQTTFVMPATNHQPVNVVATFVEDPNYLSEECILESVLLLDHSGNTFEGDQDGTAFTVTLPADADVSNLANMVLKLTYSKNAKVFRDGDTAAWNANGQACNMTLGTVTKFVVRSQKDLTEGNEGPTREYTITIKKAAAPNAPTLSGGSATRTSKTGAAVQFSSNVAGNYFYKVVNHSAAAPTVEEILASSNKGTASTGVNNITLSNLGDGARDIYIVVVDASNNRSVVLKIEIPAYGSIDVPDTGAYTITVKAPKGGTITPNRTKANAGDEIIVTVTPDSGYQMVADSLTYTLAVAGGETVKITNNRFTMPEGNVSISCQWETAATTSKGITSFSISGVVGAVNNTTNTITITLPRGTDVTKLTPVIATNGVKSLTPGNGVTVNFTNAVTYTAAMEDGSSKTYTVTVYVDKGTLADQFWDKLTDFATQVPWWEYAKHQQSTSKYPKYW